MPIVSVEAREIPQPVVTKPEITVKFLDIEAAGSSEISWNNEDLIRGFRSMFACKDHEMLVGVTITTGGIRAHIKTR